MEQFKELKWSWYKYEHEKKVLPRDFSFDTINDADALNRNLNEIHMSVLKEQDEYRLFKTPEEIIANSFGQTSDGKVFELKDPRREKQNTIKLKSSLELIDCYSYLSELSRLDQVNILNAIDDKLAHNPKFLKQQRFIKHRRTNAVIPQHLIQKYNNEAGYFNKCAEIHYHRHIKELGMLLRHDLTSLLITHWDYVRRKLKDSNYQVITMIARNVAASSGIVDINHVADKSENFNQQMYTIPPESYFPALHKYSIDNVKHHFEQQQRRNYTVSRALTVEEYDLEISLHTIAKLFVPGNEFITAFENEEEAAMSRFQFNYPSPIENVDCCEALEEAIENLLISNIEWTNVSKSLPNTQEEKEQSNFPSPLINDFMEKIYLKFKKQAHDNNELMIWKLGNANQTFTICVKNRTYFVRENVRAVISVKIEYQTNFGAEQMTKDELLKEWIQQKFTHNSVVMRYRVDAKSFEVLSIQELTIEEIEKELNELYNCNPNELLNILLNLFRCMRNLPSGDYLIHAKNEGECNKVLIYKEVLTGKSLSELIIPTQISQSFSRPWLPIDKNTTTFIHLNEFISPCCFSHKAFNKSSYIITNKKPAAAPQPSTTAPKAKKMKMNKKPPNNQSQAQPNKRNKKFGALRKSKRIKKKRVLT